jgi:hypothetical protein
VLQDLVAKGFRRLFQVLLDLEASTTGPAERLSRLLADAQTELRTGAPTVSA